MLKEELDNSIPVITSKQALWKIPENISRPMMA